MSFKIRQAHPPDIGGMVELLVELFSIEKDYKIDPPRHRAGLELFLRDTTYRSAWVAVDDENHICGMCSVQLVVSTAQGSLSGWIEDVVVRKDWRGQGVAKELLEHAESWASKLGATRVQLLADIHNTEVFTFYSKCGWDRTSMQCLKRMI